MTLQIVRTGVSVVSIRAEWTHITRTVVHKPVTNHLVLAFEAFATLATRAPCDWTVMRPARTVHIRMRTEEMLAQSEFPNVSDSNSLEQILGLEWLSSTAGMVADI